MNESQPPPIKTPHNNLFEYGMSHPETAKSLIQQMISKKVIKQIDLRTLKRQTEIEKLPTSEDPFLQSLFYLLKYSRSQQLLDKLNEVFRLIAKTADSNLANNHIFAAFIYIMATNPNINPESVKLAINESFPFYIYPDSVLGKERSAGVAEGIEKGREEGLEFGILIPKVQMQEERCGLPISPVDHFKSWSMADLKSRLAELQSA